MREEALRRSDLVTRCGAEVFRGQTTHSTANVLPQVPLINDRFGR